MIALRITIPVDKDDEEVRVTLDQEQIRKALQGGQGCACVVIPRQFGNPAHVEARIELVAA